MIHKVVQKFVMQLETQLSERNVTFDVQPDAVEWLASRGYDEKMGARPLSRVIQEHIKKPLAEEILFGKLKKGGVVHFSTGKGEDGKDGLVLRAEADDTPVKPKPEAEVAEPVAKARKGKKASPAVVEDDDGETLVRDEPAPKPMRGSVPKVPKK